MDEAQTEPGRPDREERTWAMVAHLAPLVLSAASMGLLGFLAPLLVLFLPGEKSDFVRDQARQSMNFRLTALLVYVVATPAAVLLILTGIGICIVLPVWFLFFLAELAFTIVAAVRAYEGERYRYPIAIRFLG